MQTIGRIIAVTAFAAAACGLTACGSGDTGSTATTSTAADSSGVPGQSAPTESKGRECTADDIDVQGGFGAIPQITLPDDCDPPKQLVTKDLVPGTGPGAAPGQQLTMNYALVTWSDETQLDSSFDRGEPFELTLGDGMVIPGWEQGLEGVQQGGRRLLIIPPELGYGAGGNGVKPNETLVFVTDAVTVRS
ncbi:FKBP-type peptidyl-prolyl cis-trans isomerase [Nocardia jinanensis]|uniref:Peptidyl-prolyl cis-trans isomerase n=1 Tax=Nocardia jinanensis TaxID=382504 RepID=A0A917RUR6_9NOCA|nr:FKBP-type peptidyl-prolyl cis-trans isomerase [Nocardia jinanensis]GGL34436.1 peptidyl-prolyl cis-trans isomerase [Nocardia jinanensis]